MRNRTRCHGWREFDHSTQTIAHTKCCTRALESGVLRTNDDGAIHPYNRLIGRSMVNGSPKKRFDALENVVGKT